MAKENIETGGRGGNPEDENRLAKRAIGAHSVQHSPFRQAQSIPSISSIKPQTSRCRKPRA